MKVDLLTGNLKLLAVFLIWMTNRWGGRYAREIFRRRSGDGDWFSPGKQNPGLQQLGQLCTQELENAVNELAMQGTFYRVFRLVNSGRKLESDLFEGLR